jgi:5-methylcytosine-specific restriction endonuclease McrA
MEVMMVYKVKTKICQNCGQEFTGRFPEKRMFCGVRCRQLFRNAPSRNPAKTPEARRKISESRLGRATSTGIPCPEAKKRKISQALKGRTLSEGHIKKIRESMTPEVRKKISDARQKQVMPSGEGHPNWKGGHSKERQARYKTPEYRQFVNTVLERDNYTCQWCGAKNGLGETIVLQVHHIIHYWERLDLAYDVENGITLCKPCHQKAHKGMKPPDIPSYKGKPRKCTKCGAEYTTKEGGWKYCPKCRVLHCCPSCGSTTCKHLARVPLYHPSFL